MYLNEIQTTTNGLELLVQSMSSLWYNLSSINIPILNIPFTTFILTIILVSVIIKTISIITGSHDHNGNGKD